jgi:hypothetical protein
MYQPSLLSNDSLVSSTLRAKNSMMNTFSEDLSRSLSDPATFMTDLEEHRVSSTVSVKKFRRFDIANMDNIQNVKKNKNADIKSFNNENDSNENRSSVFRRPTVSVLRMNRSLNTDETKKRSSSVIQPQASSMISITPPKNAQVDLTKRPRIKSNANRRPRAASVGNVSVIHIDRSSIEMQSIVRKQ